VDDRSATPAANSTTGNEAAAPPNVEEPPVDRYAVPAGDVSELVAFIEGLQSFRPKNQQEYMEYRAKYQGAVQAAAEKILSTETDQTSDAYKTAKLVLLQSRIATLRSASPEEQKVVANEVITAVTSKAETGLSRREISLVTSAGRSLEYGGNPDLAAEMYSQVAAILARQDNPEFARDVKRMEGAARRLRLPGNAIELQGPLLSGGELDWASYRGKVVLVDFWATWCGPCMAELPNVKKLYEAYHDRGFDVVGISLDRTREALDKHLAEDPLPWVTLFDESSAGWENPVATYYGISAIPTAILVDKEGKVISLRARGEELGALLEQQLGALAVAEAPAGEAAAQ
jgi:thiol-disulfide isomerase/thioredoxin